MFQVEELFDTVLLVFTLSVVRLFLGSSNTLNAFLKVVLKAVANTLSSFVSKSREGIFGLILVILVFFFFLFLFYFFFFLRSNQLVMNLECR